MYRYKQPRHNHIGETEHDIQSAIMQYLTLIGAKVLRINSGMIPTGEGKYRRMIRMAPLGTPDLIACHKGKFIAVEVKKRGNKPTTWQEQAIEEWKQAGALAFVAYSVEDVQKHVQEEL